jgi:hypothetical protein
VGAGRQNASRPPSCTATPVRVLTSPIGIFRFRSRKKNFSKKSPSYTTGEPFGIKCLPTPVCMVFPHAGSTSPIGIFRFKSRKKNFRKNPPPMPGGAVRQKMPPDPGRARQPPCGFRRLPLAYSGSDPKNKFLKKSPSYARGGQFDK